jgi:hemerythrin
MDKLTWSDDLSVGITKLDEQHKAIFQIINKFIDNEGVFVTSEIVADVLTELREYSEVHFAQEEKYMEITNYEHQEIHKERHMEYRRKVVEFSFDVAAHKHAAPKEILKFLMEWWSDHIVVDDKRYSKTFVEANV